MKTVRFLRAKRYPHPNGPRRKAGTVMPITDELATLWAQNGVVELTEQALTEIAESSEKMTVAELKELAAQLGVEVGRARKKDEIRAAIDQAIKDRAQAGAPVRVDPPDPVNEERPPDLQEDSGAGLTD